MSTLRHHLMRHRLLAGWVVALALLMKVLVPAGFMIGTSGGSLTIELCSGYGPMTIAGPMPGMVHHGSDKSDHGKAEQPCAFAGLSAPSLAAADPVLLALALAFIVAAILRVAIMPAPRARAFLRPPLRGPPATS